MSEKLLYENDMHLKINEKAAPGTDVEDIAQQTPKSKLARPVVSQSLPFMIGYVQSLTTPTGFVFGFKKRSETSVPGATHTYSEQQPPSHEPYGDPVANISHPSRTTNPADPMTSADADGLVNAPGGAENPAVAPTDTTPQPDDAVIVRRLVETSVREVVFDMTNEVVQDITRLFGEDFPQVVSKFIENGGEVYGFPESDTDTAMASFFIPQMMVRAVQRINEDFIEWADTTSRTLGTVQIPDLNSMPTIFTAIGEMRQALAEQTNKSGSIFIIATPKIANYIAGTLGMTNSNGSDALEIGKPNQNPHLNGFIGQFGDVKVYQYRGNRTNTNESIIMGFDGENGPNTASVYYHPYKEYLIQGGDDYMTGQSNVFFRVRDTWGVNPQDTFDGSTDGIVTPVDNQSQYLVRAEFDILVNAINP